MGSTAKRIRLAAAVAVVAVSPLLVTGCGSDAGGESAANTTTSGTTGATAVVAITDFRFEPTQLIVQVGTTVTFTNGDDVAHTATADDGSFDTGDIDGGGSASVIFDEPGEFPFVCAIHDDMRATVSVG